MFSTVTFHGVASSNLNYWPGTPLPPRAIWGLWVFLFQVNLWNFTTKTFFKKQTNTQTDLDGADLIEFVRCGCNM